MDAVNVDLDEMRARVDSTHSIITSRQRVEAGVGLGKREFVLGVRVLFFLAVWVKRRSHLEGEFMGV